MALDPAWENTLCPAPWYRDIFAHKCPEVTWRSPECSEVSPHLLTHLFKKFRLMN